MPSRRTFLSGCVALGGAALLSRADEPKLPPLPTGPVSRIAFGACHKLDMPLTIWDVMLAQKPDLFLFTGDSIYKDTVIMDEKRAEYAKLAAVPGFARFREKVPILATWDDHDYGANDGGADYPKKDEAKQIFLDFFREPKDSDRWKHGGVYGSWTLGPPGKRVQVILLDTRYFRSKLNRDEKWGGYLPQKDPNATFLGQDQWRWFAEQLKLPAELRVVVSSIQVEADEQPNEKWANIPAEKDRLYKTIADSKATGVVLVSGDRHHGEISATDVGAGYPLYEVTSSGMNCPYEPADEPNRFRLGHILWTDNFGMIQIDWTPNDPTIDLEVRTGKGFVGLRKTIKLSNLRAPAPERRQKVAPGASPG